ncbi:AMP-binding protein, partial [Pseudomonas syringae pv. tagetis]
MDVSYWQCKHHYPHPLVQIGRPVAKKSMNILDENLQPAAIGVIGDHYIAGVQLARVYFGRPDLNAERFIPDPKDNHGGR